MEGDSPNVPDDDEMPDEELVSEAAGLAVEHNRWRGATFRALRHRNYRLYFAGQLVSLLGSWMQTTALMWLAYDLTDQARWPAWIAAAQMIPAFLFGAWGGLLSDLRPRRSLIIWTQSALLVQALALAALCWTGLATPLTLLVLATSIGLVNAVDLPARLSFVVEMVNRDDLPNAVALNSMLFNVARAVGPLLAGALLAKISPGFCFLLNSFSFAAVIVALALMRVPKLVLARGKHVGLQAIVSAFGDLAQRPSLALLLGLVAVISAFGWPSQSLLPALARGIGVSDSAQGYSLLLCGAGTGAVVAALAVASLTAERWRRPLLCCGIGLTVMGLIGLALAPTLATAVGCNGLVGFGLILFMATSQSVVQLSVDDLYRGRIMGIWSMVLSGAVPLGNLLAGPAADRWSVSAVLVVQGLGCGLAFVVALFLLRFGRAGEAVAG